MALSHGEHFLSKHWGERKGRGEKKIRMGEWECAHPQWNEHGGRESKGPGYGRGMAVRLDQGVSYTDYPGMWVTQQRWTPGAAVEENQNEGITGGDSRRWKGKESNLVGRGHSKRKPVLVKATLRGSLKGSEGQPSNSMLPFLSSRVCCLEKYGSGIGVSCCPIYLRMSRKWG